MGGLQLAVCGFNRPDRTFIKTMIELAAEREVGAWTFVDDAPSDALLLNIDTLRHQEGEVNFAVSDHPSVVVACSQNAPRAASQPSEHLHMQLPLTYSRLLELLLLIECRLEHQRSQQTPNVSSRRFYEAMCMLGLLKSLIDRHRSVEITHPRYSPMRIYPAEQIFAVPLGATLTAEMFQTLPAKFLVHDLPKAEHKRPPPNWQAKPLWKLVFTAALLGSQGRLKEGANPHDKLCLSNEPDYNIVPQALEYRPICDAMLAMGPANIGAIARRSGKSIEDVIDFCNACEEMLLLTRLPASHEHSDRQERSVS